MEFGLREILILIGVLVIGGIFLDGYRRMRKSHRGALGMKIDMGGKVEEDDNVDYYGGELPAGGARPAGERQEPSFDDDAMDPIFATNPARSDAESEFEQDEAQTLAEQERARFEAEQQEMFADLQAPEPEPQPESLSADDSLVSKPRKRTAAQSAARPAAQKNRPNVGRPKAGRKAAPKNPEPEESLEESLQPKSFEEIIIINVVAKEGQWIHGTDLLDGLLACGMRFGRMNIFHRHEQANGDGDELFSMANLLEPGTFDIHKMDSFSTKGVCLFMGLPGPKNSMLAFDLLVDSSRKIAHRVLGEMRDEQHSVLTQQTIEHLRQRVQDFERRQIAKRAIPS